MPRFGEGQLIRPVMRQLLRSAGGLNSICSGRRVEKALPDLTGVLILDMRWILRPGSDPLFRAEGGGRALGLPCGVIEAQSTRIFTGKVRKGQQPPATKGSPLPIRLAAPQNARAPRRRVTVDPRCLTSRRHRVSNTTGDGEASLSDCAIVLGSSRKTGGSLNTGNTGGEARLPGLIQKISSSDENDDKANAERWRGAALLRTVGGN